MNYVMADWYERQKAEHEKRLNNLQEAELNFLKYLLEYLKEAYK